MKRRQHTSKEQSGKPGAGKGRCEDVRGSGIYPASGPWPERQATLRTEATLVRKQQPKRRGKSAGTR